MSNDKLEKLHEMTGKHWQNRNTDVVYKFLSCNQKEEIVFIATDKEWLETDVYNLNVFMRTFKEVTVANSGEISLLTQKSKTPIQSSVVMANDTFTRLKDVLLENIEKVRTDKEYVPQAKEICSSVNAIVGLAKVEIDLKRNF